MHDLTPEERADLVKSIEKAVSKIWTRSPLFSQITQEVTLHLVEHHGMSSLEAMSAMTSITADAFRAFADRLEDIASKELPTLNQIAQDIIKALTDLPKKS